MTDLPDTLRLLDHPMALICCTHRFIGLHGILAAHRTALREKNHSLSPSSRGDQTPSACPLGAIAHVRWGRSPVAADKSWQVILERFVSLSHRFNSLLARQVSWAT
jgi:hypothetical protein